ncbi:TPA: hypothetical protein HA235_01795 [Candidatus Woesearchaeota archaeon]|nr:hypothetical protein [Candidatus Woesearchaeota archaeon]HIH31417.1 hypothetical protein [Candidatus Woesearchaeota archaeon]HIH55182.1 hypothetical protein [Candidatus Woesearchaeota archaeon]HIJ14098.1 hypothetical protein [Candidatus Woesearchaeota archaeon]
MRGLRIAEILFVSFFIALIALVAVTAAPIGPSTVDEKGTSRYGLSTTAANLTAIAGNVTEVNFDATSITQTWQGYFGNITGNIVLGNANNDTLYNWVLAAPQGEVYATRDASVPAWAGIRCANSTEIGIEEVTNLGANESAGDGVTETFSGSVHPGFSVGTEPILANNCSSTNLYNDTGSQTDSFFEVLLSDAASSNLIYTALLEDSVIGFDGKEHDFQMLVGEDGHAGDTAVTPYYFYLEIE